MTTNRAVDLQTFVRSWIPFKSDIDYTDVNDGKEEKLPWHRSSLAKYMLIGGGIAAGAGISGPLCIGAVHWAGFGSLGVSAGSLAAAMMSLAGNVSSGSLIATLQSVGATGIVPWTSCFVGSVSSGCAVHGIYSYLLSDNKKGVDVGENDVDPNTDDDLDNINNDKTEMRITITTVAKKIREISTTTE